MTSFIMVSEFDLINFNCVFWIIIALHCELFPEESIHVFCISMLFDLIAKDVRLLYKTIMFDTHSNIILNC